MNKMYKSTMMTNKNGSIVFSTNRKLIGGKLTRARPMERLVCDTMQTTSPLALSGKGKPMATEWRRWEISARLRNLGCIKFFFVLFCFGGRQRCHLPPPGWPLARPRKEQEHQGKITEPKIFIKAHWNSLKVDNFWLESSIMAERFKAMHYSFQSAVDKQLIIMAIQTWLRPRRNLRSILRSFTPIPADNPAREKLP